MAEERMRDKYPILFAFGEKQEFLDHESCIKATAEERIRSIWPFISRRVASFVKTLKPREFANFDTEDVMIELYIVLMEKNGGWIPDRARYITYAGTIIDRELCSIRDRSRTVESPRNSSGRMKKYQSDEEAGEITDRRRRTAAQIARTNDISPITTGSGDSVAIGGDREDPIASMTTLERRAMIAEAVSSAIRLSLTTYESCVLGRMFGLWGQRPQSTLLVAWETVTEPIEVRRVKASAMLKMKDHLCSINHPVVATIRQSIESL